MEIIQGGKNVKVKVAGFKGAKGETGAMGAQGVAGTDGKNGLSAFAVAQANGFVGTEQEWLATLKGEKGKDGLNGVDGLDGEDGAQGIQGIQGVEGKSAYELAVIAGFEGDEAAWIASLKARTASTVKSALLAPKPSGSPLLQAPTANRRTNWLRPVASREPKKSGSLP
jgi:hypothetical protein